MPRIRSVHPDICQSATMAKLSAELERTFVRLWTHCDDEGRCEDRPKILKAALYPEHDEVTAESLDHELTLLVKHDLISRYVVDGRGYIQVTSWAEYQKPQRPRPSQYPKPPVPVADSAAKPPANARSGVGEGEGVGEGVVDGEGVSSSSDLESQEGAPKTDDDEQPFETYKRVESALEAEPELTESDRSHAVSVIWPRLRAGEKFTSPVAYALTCARDHRDARLAAERAQEPKRLALGDGTVWIIHPDGRRELEDAS